MKTNLTYEELESFFKWAVAYELIGISQVDNPNKEIGKNYQFERSSGAQFVPDKIAKIYIKGADSLWGIK